MLFRSQEFLPHAEVAFPLFHLLPHHNMGENCTRENVAETLRALQLTLENLGFKVKADMERIFYKHILY